jgi:hypothetical protein
MLQSVDARYGIGKVIRLDEMLAKFDGYVASGRAAPNAAPAAASLQVSSWTAMAVDASKRAVNLVASGDEPAWVAHVEQWPVAVELDLGGERLAITGIELDGAIEEVAMLPASIEILISSTADGKRWRSVAGGSVDFIDGKADFALAPTWARRIRLVFAASAGDPERISLRRVRVLLAD